MSKNIVICCDGSGNKFGITNTNIVKISQFCIHDPCEESQKQQLVYYDPGVGTLDLPTETLYEKSKEIWGGLGFGFGLNQNIIDAYTYLMNNFMPGDKVFLFGFSRGAYTVRALGGMLFRFGLLRKGSDNLILYVSQMYHRLRQNEKIDGQIAAEFKESFSLECKPFMIGVFDTVAAMGLIAKKKIFYDASLNPDITCGYHALSIDEKRTPFRPFLWDENQKAQHQTIEQVWFIGDHSNIGGGHSNGKLSDITLKWMLSKGVAKGLLLKDNWESKISPNPLGEISDLYHLGWGVAGLYHGLKWNRDNRIIKEDSWIHESVVDRMKHDKKYFPHLPKKYNIAS